MLKIFIAGAMSGMTAGYLIVSCLTQPVQPGLAAVVIQPVIEVTLETPLSQELLAREDYLPILEKANANTSKAVPPWIKNKKDPRSVSERAVALSR